MNTFKLTYIYQDALAIVQSIVTNKLHTPLGKPCNKKNGKKRWQCHPRGGGLPQYLFLAKIYQATKTLGNGLFTLEILMSDHQLSNLSAYFHGKFNFYDTFWDGFPISATNRRNFTETDNAQNTLKWILISTWYFQTTNVPFLPTTTTLYTMLRLGQW